MYLKKLLLLATTISFSASAVDGLKAAGAVSCQEVHGDHVRYTEYVCPLGGEKFRGTRFGSSYSRFNKQFDLRPLGSADFPMPIPICPNGFPMYKGNFTDQEITAIKTVISTDEYKQMINKETSFHLLDYVLSNIETDSTGTGVLLRASWEADGCLKDKYPAYVMRVREALERDIKAGIENKNSDFTFRLAHANTFRRLGDFVTAQKLIDSLRTDENYIKFKEIFDRFQEALDNKNTERKHIRLFMWEERKLEEEKKAKEELNKKESSAD